ncbi:MAG TPA: hypothetical protein VGP97_18150 [Burkholderiales bacterium]|nr:hypothetical protein [Burkholderiales bacterium]
MPRHGTILHASRTGARRGPGRPGHGTSQLYYRPFAIWAADQGFLAATFDAISKRASGRRLYWIGRSLGGQILGFVPNGDRIAPEHEDRLWRRHLLPELA